MTSSAPIDRPYPTKRILVVFTLVAPILPVLLLLLMLSVFPNARPGGVLLLVVMFAFIPGSLTGLAAGAAVVYLRPRVRMRSVWLPMLVAGLSGLIATHVYLLSIGMPVGEIIPYAITWTIAGAFLALIAWGIVCANEPGNA